MLYRKSWIKKDCILAVQREYDELRYMYPSSQTEMFDQLMGRIETLEKRLATKDSVELDLFRAHDEVRDLKGRVMEQDRDLSFYRWENEDLKKTNHELWRAIGREPK